MPRRTVPSPLTAKVGARIRALRSERKMSLSALDSACGISKGHLSSIENGLSAITIETVDRIARALGMPPMYLLVFPEEDLQCRITEQIREQPPLELRKIRKEIDARAAAAVKAAKAAKKYRR